MTTKAKEKTSSLRREIRDYAILCFTGAIVTAIILLPELLR